MKTRSFKAMVFSVCLGLALLPALANAGLVPSGGATASTSTPTFTWPAVSGATWYHVYIAHIGDANGRGIQGTHSQFWVSSATRWTPSTRLPVGYFRWWVQPWGSSIGYGLWSESADFRVVASVPGTITLVSPSGNVQGASQTLLWRKDARATWYQVWIRKNGTDWFASNNWFQGSGTGDMSISVGGHSPGVTYDWWVRGWSPDGYGPWSGPLTYKLITQELPAKPVLVSPSGRTSDRTPVFIWNAAARATWYHLVVKQGSTVVIDKWVQTPTFTAPSQLAIGQHSWQVSSWNESTNQEVWSDSLPFTVDTTGFLYNITLTWGQNPLDLDSHLKTPNGYHIYYPSSSMGSQTSEPFAKLDIDDITSYGPENVAIYQNKAGIYKYYIHDFTNKNVIGNTNLRGCGARVRMVSGTGTVLFDRTVPTSGAGRWWYVFDLNAQTGAITVHDTVQDTEP